MAPPVYRFEISPNNRAGCQNKACKDASIKVLKGELRFGVWVEIPNAQYAPSWKWKHWGCVTPLQISNLKQILEGLNYDNDSEMDCLDGWDELNEEMKEGVRQSLRDGHVADEEWRGVPELNRPGMKGINRRTPKKSSQPRDEDGDGTDGTPTPTKPKAKKPRAKKVKDEEADDEEEVKPKPKKRGSKVKKELDEDDPAIEPEPISKPKNSSVKKVKAEPVEDDGLGEPEQGPKAKKAAAKAKKVKAEPADDSEMAKAAPKAKSKNVKAEPTDEAEAPMPEPEKKTRPTRKRKADEPTSEPMVKKAKTSRKQKMKAEEPVEAEVEPDEPVKTEEDAGLAMQTDGAADVFVPETTQPEKKVKQSKSRKISKVKQEVLPAEETTTNVPAAKNGTKVNTPTGAITASKAPKTKKRGSKVKTEPVADAEDAQDPAEADPAAGINEEKDDADQMEVDVPVRAKKGKKVETETDSGDKIKDEKEVPAKAKRGRKAKVNA